MNEKIYGMYKGDEFIAVGTIKEIAKFTKKTEKAVKYYTYESYKRKADIGKNRIKMVLLDDD